MPISPFNAITVLTCSDSKNRSRMSAIDIVMRRVRSPTPPTRSPRKRQASFSCAERSANDVEPSFGGVRISSGPSTSARPPMYASHDSTASASFFENFANSSRSAFGSSDCVIERPSGNGTKYGPTGIPR